MRIECLFLFASPLRAFSSYVFKSAGIHLFYGNLYNSVLRGLVNRVYSRTMKAISLSDYLKHRDEEFPEEWTAEKEQNAIELLIRVNSLLQSIGVDSAEVSSGWRPAAINGATKGAAKHSYHMLGEAIDLVDNKLQSLAKLILENHALLNKYNLWMEDPAFTKNWVHLDMGWRSAREIRVFKPTALG